MRANFKMICKCFHTCIRNSLFYLHNNLSSICSHCCTEIEHLRNVPHQHPHQGLILLPQHLWTSLINLSMWKKVISLDRKSLVSSVSMWGKKGISIDRKYLVSSITVSLAGTDYVIWVTIFSGIYWLYSFMILLSASCIQIYLMLCFCLLP